MIFSMDRQALVVSASNPTNASFLFSIAALRAVRASGWEDAVICHLLQPRNSPW